MDGAPGRRGRIPRPGLTAGYLNALKAFEVAATHQSFSAAAEELSVTPAAVGQLVRSLESWPGAPLFIRAASGTARLVLTDAAPRALPDIREGSTAWAWALRN